MPATSQTRTGDDRREQLLATVAHRDQLASGIEVERVIVVVGGILQLQLRRASGVRHEASSLDTVREKQVLGLGLEVAYPEPQARPNAVHLD